MESNQNSSINNVRNVVNNNVSKLKYLGKAKRFIWESKRSFRTI